MDSIEYAEPERINGLNLFAYCGNNPVMFVDPSGHWFFTVLIICAVVGAAIGGTISGVEAAKNGGSALEVTAAVITGGAIGGTIGLGAGIIGGGGAVIAGGGAVILGAGAVVAGSAILAGSVVGSIALANVLFSKGYGSRQGHNNYENKQYNDAMKELGFSKNSPEWDIGHRELGKAKKFGEYFDTYEDLLEFLKGIFGL